MPRGKKALTSDGKVALQVLISQDLYEKLLDIAPREYGNIKGALSYIVEQALRAYLSPRLHTQMHTNPIGRVKRVFLMVKECLRELEGGVVPEQTPAKKLEMCIAEVRGSDFRTIEKWIREFLRHGLIKDLTPSNPPKRKIYEIMHV